MQDVRILRSWTLNCVNYCNLLTYWVGMFSVHRKTQLMRILIGIIFIFPFMIRVTKLGKGKLISHPKYGSQKLSMTLASLAEGKIICRTVYCLTCCMRKRSSSSESDASNVNIRSG